MKDSLIINLIFGKHENNGNYSGFMIYSSIIDDVQKEAMQLIVPRLFERPVQDNERGYGRGK